MKDFIAELARLMSAALCVVIGWWMGGALTAFLGGCVGVMLVIIAAPGEAKPGQASGARSKAAPERRSS